MNLKLINNMSLNQLMTVYMFDSRTSVLTNDTVDMIYLKNILMIRCFVDSYFSVVLLIYCTLVARLEYSCDLKYVMTI